MIEKIEFKRDKVYWIPLFKNKKERKGNAKCIGKIIKN